MEDYKRLKVFEWLRDINNQYDGILPRKVLEAGINIDGQQIHLVAPQGIFLPQGWEKPISITTSPQSPYKDEVWDQGYIQYQYRGTNIMHRENASLRQAMKDKTPLIYFHGLRPGWYVSLYPCYVVNDEPSLYTFTIAIDELSSAFQMRSGRYA